MLEYRRYALRGGDIFDADSGDRVGYVELPRNGWLSRKLGSARLEAREPPDGSLVFVVSRKALTHAVEVRDPNDNLAGRVRANRILDPRGRPFAWFRHSPGVTEFRDAAGTTLAEYDPDGSLELAEPLAERPPDIMLVLAAVLAFRYRFIPTPEV